VARGCWGNRRKGRRWGRGRAAEGEARARRRRWRVLSYPSPIPSKNQCLKAKGKKSRFQIYATKREQIPLPLRILLGLTGENDEGYDDNASE
jgi:hypothetical protein